MNDGTEHIEVELKMPSAISSSMAFAPSETQALSNFLGAEPNDDRLSKIAEFVRADRTEFSDIDLLQAVRGIETRLGTPRIGEKRIDLLYNYIKLQGQIEGLEKERDSLLRLH